jgi:hypothetical protein
MSKKSVEIFQRDGKWIVRVANAGETFEREFDHPPYAKSFGSGQAIRLGVAITDIDSQVPSKSSTT